MVLAVFFIGHRSIVPTTIIAELWESGDITTAKSVDARDEWLDEQIGCKQEFSQITSVFTWR